ncbi:MAG: hypothetical protein IPI38_17715 [Gemmatimonadetes bacterium]|jgi:hypothetical protein|nr:hypothetical protein [Gemmatimonadota bacterium]MBK6781887.1 hypothetical protein [Gemmatimonadota bacterium]MBK7352034.1 hypothetical protein [Gemmatimonadota bacterium]MBK7717211.1 hypothetical protein [Gemmatimonadota bacterium]MBK7784929.1 hypothetical protein [Gemmatimonadota bacterium]
MARAALQLLLLALLGAAGTWFGGWWALPIIGGVYGWRGGRPLLAGLGAALAWGALFLMLPAAPVGRLLTRLGALAHLPGPALIALTLLFAGLLGWSAARLVAPETRPSR